MGGSRPDLILMYKSLQRLRGQRPRGKCLEMCNVWAPRLWGSRQFLNGRALRLEVLLSTRSFCPRGQIRALDGFSSWWRDPRRGAKRKPSCPDPIADAPAELRPTRLPLCWRSRPSQEVKVSDPQSPKHLDARSREAPLVQGPEPRAGEGAAKRTSPSRPHSDW